MSFVQPFVVPKTDILLQKAKFKRFPEDAPEATMTSDLDTNAFFDYPFFRQVRVLFSLAEHRVELYYAFGLFCLIGWLAFNLWILRDYFFPCWFNAVYTETGLSKQKLESRKQEIIMRNRISNAFSITTNVAIPGVPIRFDSISETRRSSVMPLRHSILVV